MKRWFVRANDLELNQYENDPIEEVIQLEHGDVVLSAKEHTALLDVIP